VVDVVDLALVAAQLQEVLDAVDDVFGLQRLLGLGDVEAELAVQAEAADAAEAVARRVEELLAEELLRLVEVRRIARAQAPVDLEQRLLVVRGRVLGERVDDQRDRRPPR
jgi:hypothetical protein